MPLITTPGGKPETAMPGETPRLPLITLGPVLVTAEPARTAKGSESPRRPSAWALNASSVTPVKQADNTLVLVTHLLFLHQRHNLTLWPRKVRRVCHPTFELAR